jgi:hypothetical protein
MSGLSKNIGGLGKVDDETCRREKMILFDFANLMLDV